MKTKLLAIAITSSLIGFNANAAATGDITISGQVVAPVCEIDSGNTTTALTLDSVDTSSLGTTAGVMAGVKPFTIGLQNCISSTGSVQQFRVKFEGTGDTNATSVLKNTGTATGVGIAILKDDASTVIDINGGPSKADLNDAPASTGSAVGFVLNFNAAYYNTGATLGGGDVQATTKWLLEYI